MKYVCYLFLILIFCSCCTPQKNTDILSNIPENVVDENNKANQYSFKFADGTYWNMNDLTYFLTDTSIKSLDLYRGTFSDLSPLTELTVLEELSIESNDYVTDISPIGSLVNLKKLKLSNEGYRGSIEAISSLVNLRNLNLHYNDRCYKELVPLQQLEELTLSNAPMVVFDATYIAQLSSLKMFAYTGGGDPEGIINIEQLRNLVNLEELYISSNNNLDLSWITRLQKLEKLATSRCTIDNISPLLELPNLVNVDFTKTEVKDITPLLKSRSIKNILIAYPPNEINDDKLYRLFEERGIEFTVYYHDR